MANNYAKILELSNKNNMGLSNTIKRDYGIPLDYSSVQVSYAAAVIYAATDTLAYVGQPIAVGDKLYIISDQTSGTYTVGEGDDAVTYDIYLKEVGTKPTGDEQSITISADGKVAIYGFSAAANATLPRKKADGTLEWVSVDAVVSGDGNTKTVVKAADDSDITVTQAYDEKNDTYTYTLDVMLPPVSEYTITKETGTNVINYKLTKDGAAFGETVVVPNAYDDTALKNKVNNLEKIKHADDVTYDSTNKKIYLVSGTEKIGEGFDASAFIKDGMIQSVELKDNKLLITWNLDGRDDSDKEKTTEIDLSHLIDIYTAGTGISINGKEIAVNTSVIATVEELNKVKQTAEDAQTAGEVSSAIGTALASYTKTSDLDRDYAKKATTLAGYGITDAYTATQTDQAILAKIGEVTGGESAADVLAALNAYKAANDREVWGDDFVNSQTNEGKYTPTYTGTSRVDAIKSKVDNIEDNAEKNIIEAVKINGTVLEVNTTDRAVNITPAALNVYNKTETDVIKADVVKKIDDHINDNFTPLAETVAKLTGSGEGSIQKIVTDSIDGIPTATDKIAGLVKASDEIHIANDGELSLGGISTDKLVQGTHTLILKGGSAIDKTSSSTPSN